MKFITITDSVNEKITVNTDRIACIRELAGFNGRVFKVMLDTLTSSSYITVTEEERNRMLVLLGAG